MFRNKQLYLSGLKLAQSYIGSYIGTVADLPVMMIFLNIVNVQSKKYFPIGLARSILWFIK